MKYTIDDILIRKEIIAVESQFYQGDDPVTEMTIGDLFTSKQRHALNSNHPHKQTLRSNIIYSARFAKYRVFLYNRKKISNIYSSR